MMIARLPALTVFLFMCIVSFQARTQDLQPIPLASIDSEALLALTSFTKNARVVGMGESTHGTHEFFESRINFFKVLVEKQGFNTFFLEADYANCRPIDKYIKGEAADIEALVEGLGLWPWITEEMVSLVSWMRAYNDSTSRRPISFIGVDIQKPAETISLLIDVLGTEAPSRLIALSKVDNKDFLSYKKKDLKEYYKVLEELKCLELQKLDKASIREFNLLCRQLHLILDEQTAKASTHRDQHMAENILLHVEADPNLKGFFWAHNVHIAKWYKPKKQTGMAGGVLKHHLKDQYISIGQEYYQGSFNVYYATEVKASSRDISKYTLGPVTVGPAAQGSLAANYKSKYPLPLFIPFATLPADEKVYMGYIGARYVVDNDPSSIWRYNHHGKEAFDAVLLIDRSTPTSLLKSP